MGPEPIVVAIDGPAASGKSTVARRLAAALGFAWVNSGAFYRAITWHLLREPAAAESRAAAASKLAKARVNAEFDAAGARLLLDGCDPSAELRSPEVNRHVSPVSQFPEVRELVGRELRRLAAQRDCVVEGRDIGTCVFPDTPHKFYVDAAPEERARRRRAQGEDDEILERDRMDSGRALAPLAAAADAVVVDSTHLTIEQVTARILEDLARRGVGVLR
ncbi:MAG: (d)CMP kinase [Terrimicrobiaceae bacterium]|nr:(d)CMP kinase [Terrimicrobiaceae bacterium]